MSWLLVLCLLVAAAGATQWHLIHDVKVSANQTGAPAMPCIQHASYAGAATQKPTVVIAAPFVIPAGLHCPELVVDLPLKRIFAHDNTTVTMPPGRARFFLWRNTVPSGDFQYASLSRHSTWTVTPTWAEGVSPVMQRFPYTSTALLTSGVYYLGVYVEQANYSLAHGNSVWWTSAAPGTVTATFVYVDVYGNFLANTTRAAEFVLFTRAPAGTAFYAGRSIEHVGMSIFARCANDTAFSPYSTRTFPTLPEATFGEYALASPPPPPVPSPASSPATGTNSSANATAAPSVYGTGTTASITSPASIASTTSVASPASVTSPASTVIPPSPLPSPSAADNVTAVPGEAPWYEHLAFSNGVIVGALFVVGTLAVIIVLVALIVRHRRKRGALPIMRAARQYRDDDDVELDELESSGDGKPALGTITVTPIVVSRGHAERNLLSETIVGGAEEEEDGDEEGDAPFHAVPLGDQEAERREVAKRLNTGRASKPDYIAMPSKRAGKK